MPGGTHRAIGLEIGDGMVKALEVSVAAKKGRILHYAKRGVNFREGRDGIVNAIKDVLREFKLKKNSRVNIAVSGESVTVRDINWPEMNPADIRKALKLEVERQTNYKSEDIVFDYYSMVDKTQAEATTRVMLVAAKKDLLENYIGLIKAAGYACGVIEVDTFSVLNCFYAHGPRLSADKTVAVVNIGMEVTNIDIIRGKHIGLTKDAFVAWSNLVDALPAGTTLDFNNISQLKGLLGSDDVYELCLFITNAVTNQIRRTIEFYESQGRLSVDEIYLSGRMATFKHFDSYLQNVLGLRVILWNPLGAMTFAAREVDRDMVQADAPMLAICSGLASPRTISVNLSPGGATARMGGQTWQKISALLQAIKPFAGPVLAMLLVFFALGGIWLMLSNQVHVKRQALELLKTKNTELLALVEQINELQQTRAVFADHAMSARGVIARRRLWTPTLNALSDTAPEQVWLTELLVKAEPAPVARTVMGVAADPSTGAAQPAPVVPVVLGIKGVVVSAETDMLVNLNEFIRELQLTEVFARDFEPVRLVRTYSDTIEQKPVMRFELMAERRRK